MLGHVSSGPPDNRKERPPRRGLAALLVGVSLVGVALADPLPFRQYPGVEYYDFELPTDFRVPAEWVFARLMYPSLGWGGQWQYGGTSWTIDYPRGDRHIAALVRRLSVIDARSVEQPVNLEDGDDVFNWPWLYAVEVGQWDLTDSQAAQLREYLLRGGFLMVDDFHGTREWANFEAQMKKVFPERQIEDVDISEPIFHCFFDIEKLFELPGLQFLYSHRMFEKDGKAPRYAAIYDDNHRIMVMINHNVDIGDAWEWADLPQYPARYTTQAYRLGVNYIVYALSH